MSRSSYPSMRLKILLITGIFPPDIGGPATYVPSIAKGLVERGHSVTVLTLSDQLTQNDQQYPFLVIRLPRKMPKPWRQIKTMLQILKQGRAADLLFVNGLAFESVLANMVLRKPLVMKVVGDLAWERATTMGWVRDNFETFQEKRYSLKIEFLKWLRTWWTRRADRIITPSRYLAKWVAHWGVPEDRIAVIYNALQRVNDIRPATLPLETKVNAVTVGRLVPWKRVDRILEAIAQIRNMGLVIVGDGPERERLERMAWGLGLNDRVYFAGSRSKPETLSLMAACDLFVLNSTYEGLPHVVLEAMSLGLPVVATSVGGTPEVVQHRKNGILISPVGDDLVATLRWLREDIETRHQLAKGAKETAKAFAFVAMLDATERVLQETVQRRQE